MLVALAIAGGVAGCGGKSASTSATTTASTLPATEYPFKAKLDSTVGSPKPKGAEKASGNYAGTMTLQGGSGTIDWRLSYKGLTGGATVAQVHLGLPGKSGVAALNLCGPCPPDAHGSIGANAGLLLALIDRPTYVEVQTKHNPRGEIRGRIKLTKPAGATGG
jgi:hypothetical protein